MVEPCAGVARDGKPCRARPQPGSAYCLAHDPAIAAERRAWSARGGRNRSNEARARKRLVGEATDLAALQATVQRALEDLRGGRLEAGEARAIAALVQAGVAVAKALQVRFPADYGAEAEPPPAEPLELDRLSSDELDQFVDLLDKVAPGE